MLQHCVVRDLPKSFTKCVTSVDLQQDPIDWELATEQHNAYVETLKKFVPHVIAVPADEKHPDCCFVEDTTVCVNGTAVINHMGHDSRRKEVDPIASALEKIPTIKKIVRMEAPACADGGDVLTIGNYIFAGLSHRTNEQGVAFLKEIFGETHSVFGVPMADTLHLKCLVTAINPQTIMVADNKNGRAVFEFIQQKSNNAFKAVYVPDEISANVLSFPEHGAIIIQQGFPESEKIITEAVKELQITDAYTLNMSEFRKADGALTCCSILI
ncbi:hypothetical protein K493DRAFT_285096 [Basidiobolus meristosporus CBS 931.73]|uniref:Uncharacterized protein n=1 Tax=Basidiobolus meristosporus CBS 931.73 TaxID=1314790 RepID=A0A1Y1Y505_9FUNG|nr:hypothetical protein K493DRAFT_285096 [Basidiobolus meristosporus CBS 931.73]|eukprot:ORX93077.1 hypothetical protein K493DRAFT_285096 [Basidiobolus meristosporus CBS 931.73]